MNYIYIIQRIIALEMKAAGNVEMVWHLCNNRHSFGFLKAKHL